MCVTLEYISLPEGYDGRRHIFASAAKASVAHESRIGNRKTLTRTAMTPSASDIVLQYQITDEHSKH